MPNWKLLGTICGICAAPFTGGASLAVCAACTGLGFVGGTIAEKVFERNKSGNQTSPEALGLLNKNIEELSNMRKELENSRQKELENKKNLENKLEEVRAKLNDPKKRESYETEEELKNNELLIMNEIKNINKKVEEKDSQINNIITKQTDASEKSINMASGNSWGNFFQFSSTTKLMIIGAIILFLYLLIIKK